jgi:beta-lactamase superfamily II metal-dependent hydrolase
LITSPPNVNEVEITVIGTGGGYGESIVVKTGISSWIIIDSCINPSTKEPLATQYLQNIGVDLNDVKLVICTHWHNDHIRGISKVLQQCENAEFCFSDVHDLQKFLYLCELDHTKTEKGSISSTNEFAKCLQIVSSRNQYTLSANFNTIVFCEKNQMDFVLYALSPSPKTVNDFKHEISQLITDFGESNIAMPNNSPNDKSVALLLTFGDHSVLLGADLEQGNCENTGWRHILRKCNLVGNNKANLYKIPHHGSHNGYLGEIFEVLVNNDSILKMTPFNKSGLPRDEMINLYKTHSNTIYSTSPPTSLNRAKRREMTLEKFIERTAKVSEIKFNYGIVRSRIDYTLDYAKWDTQTFHSAVQL